MDNRRITVVLVFAVIALASLVAIGFTSSSSDRHDACVIQSRNLRAQHSLVLSLEALQRLVSLKPVARETSLHREVRGSLNTDLGAYITIVSKQPPDRSC